MELVRGLGREWMIGNGIWGWQGMDGGVKNDVIVANLES
jgi:hypothetical protein